MTAVDLDKYRKLMSEALELEKVLAASPHGVNPVFQNALANVRTQIVLLENGIREAEENARIEQAVAAAAAEQETALSQSERETFAGFLKEDYFTKNDMSRVNEFYKSSWERLTEGGKEAMSHRVWEGIRHGEEKFSDLLDDIKEKEAKHLYKLFTDPSIEVGTIANVPESDKRDFIHAYESGNSTEVYKILNRESFTNNVSVEVPQAIKNVEAQKNHETENKGVLSNVTTDQARTGTSKPKADSAADMDLTSIDLQNLKLPDDKEQGVAANALRSDGTTVRRL